MGVKIFLGITAAVFIGYGLVCLAQPSVVADATGMLLSTSTATVETRAMYGGLQTAVGLLALLGAVRPGLATSALLTLVFVFFGLASGRLIGIAVDSDASAYSLGAVCFEVAWAGGSLALLSRAGRAEPGERAAP